MRYVPLFVCHSIAALALAFTAGGVYYATQDKAAPRSCPCIDCAPGCLAFGASMLVNANSQPQVVPKFVCPCGSDKCDCSDRGGENCGCLDSQSRIKTSQEWQEAKCNILGRFRGRLRGVRGVLRGGCA